MGERGDIIRTMQRELTRRLLEFNLKRHVVKRETFKERRSAALAEWQMVMA